MKDEKPTIHNEFHFHAPVGQNIAHVDTLNVTFDKDMKMQVLDVEKVEEPDETSEPCWPDELCTDAAMGYWRKLEKRGFVAGADHHLTDKTTRILAAYIAELFAEQMGIEDSKWKIFEQGWGVKHLGTYMNRLNNLSAKRRPVKNMAEIDVVFET